MPGRYEVQLANYCAVYDMVDENPGAGVNDVAIAINRIPAVVRAWLRYMANSGSLQRVEGTRSPAGTMPNSFYAVPGKRPTDLPTGRGKAHSDRDRIAEQNEYAPRRPRAPAKQIGMAPDPFALPASFFRSAAVA